MGLVKYNTNRTYERVEAMKKRAVRFVQDVLGDPAHADEIENESVESYAARKRITIKNPEERRSTAMEATMTKAELEDTLDDVEEILDDALDPKLTREELVEKVQEVYAIVAGEEDDEADDDEAEDEADED